jgi:hypothetical protein
MTFYVTSAGARSAGVTQKAQLFGRPVDGIAREGRCAMYGPALLQRRIGRRCQSEVNCQTKHGVWLQGAAVA